MSEGAMVLTPYGERLGYMKVGEDFIFFSGKLNGKTLEFEIDDIVDFKNDDDIPFEHVV